MQRAHQLLAAEYANAMKSCGDCSSNEKRAELSKDNRHTIGDALGWMKEPSP
jgi:hypothetical protein